LIYRHKQFIASLAVLVIVLVQFGSLLHATDHPFHTEETLCITLSSSEQGKHFYHAAVFTRNNDVFVSHVLPLPAERASLASSTVYSSRAPPQIAI